MSNSQIRSRQEAVEHLHSYCTEALECLRKLNGIHLAIDYPERTVSKSEPECVLRLRKVYFHVRAVTFWTVDTDILHVMAPDIRAARKHLEPIVAEKMHRDPSHSVLTERRKYAARKEKLLSRFAHPTPQILIQPRDVGGLGKADAILCLCQLSELLIGVVADYGFALGEIADLLDPSKEPGIVEVMDRAGARFALFPRDAVLQFAEKGTQHEVFWGLERSSEFTIGGYRPAEQRLKDRKGRTLTTDDVLHYRKMCGALAETQGLIAEIDSVIEGAGGWPLKQTLRFLDYARNDMEVAVGRLAVRDWMRSQFWIPAFAGMTEVGALSYGNGSILPSGSWRVLRSHASDNSCW